MKRAELSWRPVAAEDVPLICRFPESAEELSYMFPKAAFPLAPEELRAAIDARGDSTVVLANGAPAGFANFYATGESCAIGNVIVDPKIRGQGVATFLIETMIGIAVEKHKARNVVLVCFHRNVVGLLLHTKLGFRPYAIEERTQQSGARTAIIRMTLSMEDWLAHR